MSTRSWSSLWSRDSALSIASEGSVLSIGSVGSVASIGSIGSSMSLFSVGSWLSVGSALSAASVGSVLSWRSVGGVRSAGGVRAAGCAAAVVVLAAVVAGRRQVAATVAEYLAAQPDDVRARLEELRRVVTELAPELAERISYAMPVSTLDGVLLHVGAWRRRIGLHPVPVSDPVLEAEVAPLRSGRDTVQLRHADPFPRELVVRLVQALVDRRG